MSTAVTATLASAKVAVSTDTTTSLARSDIAQRGSTSRVAARPRSEVAPLETDKNMARATRSAAGGLSSATVSARTKPVIAKSVAATRAMLLAVLPILVTPRTCNRRPRLS